MTPDPVGNITRSPFLVHIAAGLLVAAGGILATPLTAGPLVLLALIATLLMLVKGNGTLKRFGQPTLHARNILLIAFGGWFIAELLSTVFSNQRWTNLDYPLRFLLGMGVFWVIRYVEEQRMAIFLYGIVASAAAAAIFGFYQYFALDMDRSLGWSNHPIYFGNLSALLCTYIIIALVTLRVRITGSTRFLLLFAALLLASVVVISGARSSWLGLAGLLVLIDWRKTNYMRLAEGGLVIATSLAAALIFVPGLLSGLRIDAAIHDIQGILSGDYRSSIGDRLQMWQAALLMFQESPLIGIGSGSYQQEVTKLVAAGAIDIELVNGSTVYNQAHSEIMDILATKGLTGLLAYIVMLVLPSQLFAMLSRTTNLEARTVALMGQASIIAFLMFGLTLATFKVQIYCVVFPAMVAMLTALALNLTDAGKPEDHG